MTNIYEKFNLNTIIFGVFTLLILILLVLPGISWAVAHEECEICHGNRLGVGLAILTKDRHIAKINPSTGKPMERIEAICLSCHAKKIGDDEDIFYDDEDEEDGEEGAEKIEYDLGMETTSAIFDEMMLEAPDVGLTVINLHETHPVGIVPKTVVLPDEAKGFKGQEEQLTCMGCHNHHPYNKNYKYLRWPANEKDLSGFCANCHPDKVKTQERRQRPSRLR